MLRTAFSVIKPINDGVSIGTFLEFIVNFIVVSDCSTLAFQDYLGVLILGQKTLVLTRSENFQSFPNLQAIWLNSLLNINFVKGKTWYHVKILLPAWWSVLQHICVCMLRFMNIISASNRKLDQILIATTAVLTTTSYWNSSHISSRHNSAAIMQ